MFRFLTKQSRGLTSASLIIAGGAILSRLLGLVRDRVFASQFGAGRELDIYYAAFRVPDFIYSILILGAISATFIPLFSSLLHKDEEEGLKPHSPANHLASSMLTDIVVLLAILALILMLFAPFVIAVVAPGLSAADKQQATFLTRIMLLQPIFLGASHVLTGILQSFRKFVITSLAPSFYNLGIIFGALFLVKPFGLQGLALGVILGAALHLLVQIPFARHAGFSWDVGLRNSGLELKKTIRLMGPRVFAVMSDQIDLLVVTAIASTLALGSIAIFNLAQNIGMAPVGIIGITFATAAFPALSRTYSHQHTQEFLDTFARAFRSILFFSIPLTILFILLRAQMVRVILGSGHFGWQDTRLTAAALGLFGISLFAQTLIPLFARGFYAMHNTKTPMIIGAAATVTNLVLSLSLLKLLTFAPSFYAFVENALKLNGVRDISVVILPLSFSFTTIFEFFALLFFFLLRFPRENLASLVQPWYKNIAAAALMTATTFLALRPLANVLNMESTFGVFLQGFVAGTLGLVVYFLTTALLKENPFLSSSKLKVKS